MTRKRPEMYTRVTRTLAFGDGSRGMNANSELNLDEGQLRDCLNLWYQAKELRGRPAVRYQGSLVPGGVVNFTPVAVSPYCLLSEVRNGDGEVLEQDFGFYVLYLNSTGEGFEIDAFCTFGTHGGTILGSKGTATVVQNKDGSFQVGRRRGLTITGDTYDGVSGTYTRVADEMLLFCGSKVQTLAQYYNSSLGVYEFQYYFKAADPYIPVTMMNRAPELDGSSEVRTLDYYNILTPRWQEWFTTDDTKYLYYMSQKPLERKAVHTVEYTFMHKDGSDEGQMETVTFTVASNDNPDANMAYSDWKTVTSGSASDTYSQDYTIRVAVYYDAGLFAIFKDDGGVFFLRRGGNETNNLKITTELRHGVDNDPYDDKTYWDPTSVGVISDTVASAWFGGETNSLDGGAQIFVAGNRQHPELVYYSSPIGSFQDGGLYFPEDYCVAVGDPGDPVVAMARQGGALVVFKRNSIYAITYDGFDQVSAIDGYVRKHPRYTVTCISDRVGCWAKGSIQLCDNYLVFYGTGSRIYLLRSLNQYTTRSVREISMNIEALIENGVSLAPEVMQNDYNQRFLACSCDWKGYYILISGDKAWAWHYRATPYIDTSNTDKVQTSLAWYRFTFPVTFHIAGAVPGEAPALFSRDQAFVWDYDGDADGVFEDGEVQDKPFERRYVSQLLDMGEPYTLKAVSEVFLSLGKDSTATTKVKGNFDLQTVPIHRAVAQGQNGAPDKVWRLYPQRKPARRIGITIEANGKGKLIISQSPTAAVDPLGSIH